MRHVGHDLDAAVADPGEARDRFGEREVKIGVGAESEFHWLVAACGLAVLARDPNAKPQAATVDHDMDCTYSSSIPICLKKSCSSQPIGLLKKHARCLRMPVSPRRWARAVRRTISIRSGAARSESQPCQMNCRIIFVFKKP